MNNLFNSIIKTIIKYNLTSLLLILELKILIINPKSNYKILIILHLISQQNMIRLMFRNNKFKLNIKMNKYKIQGSILVLVMIKTLFLKLLRLQLKILLNFLLITQVRQINKQTIIKMIKNFQIVQKKDIKLVEQKMKKTQSFWKQ